MFAQKNITAILCTYMTCPSYNKDILTSFFVSLSLGSKSAQIIFSCLSTNPEQKERKRPTKKNLARTEHGDFPEHNVPSMIPTFSIFTGRHSVLMFFPGLSSLSFECSLKYHYHLTF